MPLVPVNLRPDTAQLRGFGMVCLVAFGLLGALCWWRQGLLVFSFSPETAQVVSWTLWGLALVCFVLGLTLPQALRPLWIGLIVLTLPIGFVVSYVVLGLVFFGVFLPIGLYFRLVGRDVMQRRPDPNARTYWTQRRSAEKASRYFQQY